jgi:hypothetical protein
MAILLGGELVTVERYTGTYVAGEWTPVLDSSFDVELSVQPISGREQERLPEAYRTSLWKTGTLAMTRRVISGIYSPRSARTGTCNGDAHPPRASSEGVGCDRDRA